jgi:hypothetical protein
MNWWQFFDGMVFDAFDDYAVIPVFFGQQITEMCLALILIPCFGASSQRS